MTSLSTTRPVLAEYANGVFTPMQPVSLPENAHVTMSIRIVTTAAPLAGVPGSQAARAAYAERCRSSQFKSGRPRPSREELHDRD